MVSPRRPAVRGMALVPLVFLLLVVAVVWAQRERLLSMAGTSLVLAGEPRRADAIVVLAGGLQGERILKAAELLRAGLAPRVLVSDAIPIYEQPECRLAVAMAVRRGAPEEAFECVAPGVRSTREEARAIVPVLRSRGVRAYLLVTTEFHTRRAALLFRREAPDLEVIPVASDSVDFPIARWYAHREGRKTVLLEWLKTAATYLGA